MTTKKTLPIVAAIAALGLTACAQKPVELTFVDHITADLTEQDAYVEKWAGSGKVYRITPKESDTYKGAPVYGTAEVVHHAPFNPNANGPYSRGQALGMTMGEWLAGSGTATYSCRRGKGTIQASFKKLVPDGVYTMWYAFVGKGHMGCADCPFTTIDFPMGDSDGSQSAFTADADGSADYDLTFSPCLELSGERLAAMLAIAYHSDGKTYGPDPGPFGQGSHVQLFTMLPDKGGM